MKKPLIILILVVIVIAAAIYFLSNDSSMEIQQEEAETTQQETQQETEEDESAQSGGNAVRQGSVVLNDASNVLSYTDPEGMELAMLQSGATLAVLYFYADWCPLCSEEFPQLIEAMDELKDLPVLAFQVNYNDSSTDSFDQDLAREHGVAYQHTKVFLVDGKRVLKSPESWDKSRYIQEITKILE